MKKVFNRRQERKNRLWQKNKATYKREIPRIVFRRTNRYIIAQYITSKEAKDTIEIGLTSKNLEKYGWPKEFEGSLKSITAAYLTGFLWEKRLLKEKKEKPIFDIGMTSSTHKTRPYAFLKGLIDAGLKIES